MFATVECASQVNLQDLLPKFSSSLLERSSREPAGIIHQAVQFSIALHGLFYQRCTLLFLPHVSRAEEGFAALFANDSGEARSEEHTSELQSRQYLVCRLLLEKKKKNNTT